ncbi:TRAP transporter substrate-binding protein DctP [Pseudonocardia sp. MH-G8]|uniref:TRAP transporter substrate-binding protein DctP n=1 Tax=Pseudonocardia sp. MH-G8 TaxID=1854588 RepID=UPI000BA04FA8|nr:TRAP transporter substrate-binding protein DctP [Pseudonocardia sp. MH-G8]OZM76913.1 hypothetical protein CFP66_38960 [Pseudonocardia sp. MH-G8]
MGSAAGRRRWVRGWAALAAVIPLLGAVACSSGRNAPSGAQIRLTVADSKSTKHYVVEGALVPWMHCIEEGTGGRVGFDFFPAEQLGALADYPSLLRHGLVDVAYVPPAQFEGEMPLSEVHTLPGLFTDSVVASQVFARASKETEIAEVDYLHNGMRPLWGAMTVPSEIFTRGPVKSLADMAGMKLRGSGGTLQAVLDQFGVNTLTLPTTEVYQAIETGTADGTVMATASVASYSVDEVTRYATDGADLGTFWTSYAISAGTWDELPEDVRAVFDRCDEQAVENGAAATEAATEKARARFESEEFVFTPLPAADRQSLQHIYEGVASTWAEDKRGIGGPQVLSYIRDHLTRS